MAAAVILKNRKILYECHNFRLML